MGVWEFGIIIWLVSLIISISSTDDDVSGRATVFMWIGVLVQFIGLAIDWFL